MKKGCFLKSIIILTILLAVVLYLFEHHFDDLVIKPGKGILKDIALSEITKKFDKVKKSPEKDSLEVLINDFVESKINKIDFEKDNKQNGDKNIKININDDELDNQIQRLMDSLNIYLNDNIVDKKDLQKVIEILKENKK